MAGSWYKVVIVDYAETALEEIGIAFWHNNN